MKQRISCALALVTTLAALGGRDAAAQQIDRTVLPIPEPEPVSITELSARDVKPPSRFEVKAPQGAPNSQTGRRRQRRSLRGRPEGG